MSTETVKCSPGWYAVGAVVAIPVVAVGMAVTAVCMLIVWPVVPFVAYRQRRDELLKERCAKLTEAA